MKKENINSYYTDEDLINFKKLNNFKDFKVNKSNTNENKSHPVRYARSDDKHFNKIININKNNENSLSKEAKAAKHKNYYYTSLDFENFNKLKQFTAFNNNESVDNKTEAAQTNTNYTSNDVNAFDQIIKSRGATKNDNENKNNSKVDKKKIKIVDYSKLNEKEKNLKNKVGIEKIKIVYFD